MERTALLTARIALYRRYLNEGADGDIARSYLRLIKQNEEELTALRERNDEQRAGTPSEHAGVLPLARA